MLSRACAQAAPESRLTLRSAERPPRRTATWVNRRCAKASSLRESLCQGFTRGVTKLGHAQAYDLPLERHAGFVAHACTHGLAQTLDVLGRGIAVIDEEVAVHVRDFGAADAQTAAAGLIDELPGAGARRVLERGAAGALADRLIGLAIFGHRLHLPQDGGRLGGTALEQRLGKYPVTRHAAVPVGELHGIER